MRGFRIAAIAIAVGLTLSACGEADEGADTAPATGAETTALPGDGTTTAGTEEEEVVMQDISFQPDEVTVSLGTTVTWTNQDAVAHTTTSEDGVWDSGEMGEGESFSHTFEEPGTYTYVCEIHPAQMQATVVVED